MEFILAVIILLFIFSITAALLVLVIGPPMLLHPRRRTSEWYEKRGEPLSPADLGMQFEESWFRGHDEVVLHSWFIPSSSPAKGSILYLHGVGDNKIDGVPLSKVFHDAGYNVFLYDSRAHGASGGRYCTYGYYEKFDVPKAIDALMQQSAAPDIPIGVFGTSMGAAVAIQAATVEKRIRAVIAEGCFTNLRTISVDYQKRLIRLPWHYLRNIVMKRSEHLAKFKHHDVSPLASVRDVHLPILFIHGKSDTFIKYQYSETLFQTANEPKELYLIENANHTDTFKIAKKGYEQRVTGFFNRRLVKTDTI